VYSSTCCHILHLRSALLQSLLPSAHDRVLHLRIVQHLPYKSYYTRPTQVN
jgi:hypothetical protein